MGYYWLSYFDNYIRKRNLLESKIYEYNDDKIIIVPNNNDFPLLSNIFRINGNKAYQFFSLSQNKIIINNIIHNITITDTYIKLNNSIYNLIKYDINDLKYYPIQHTIKIKNIKDISNKYQITLYSDTYNEYTKNIPLVFVDKNDINNKFPIYESIYRYLHKNKFIGSVIF